MHALWYEIVIIFNEHTSERRLMVDIHRLVIQLSWICHHHIATVQVTMNQTLNNTREISIIR